MDQKEENKLVEHMLSEVESELDRKNRTNEFIVSLRDQFERKGFLTKGQIDALKKFYERVA